jgi:hypothetical protein
VAVAAIDAVVSHMMFMAERYRLVRRNAHIRDEMAAVHPVRCRQNSGSGQTGYYNTHLRK